MILNLISYELSFSTPVFFRFQLCVHKQNQAYNKAPLGHTHNLSLCKCIRTALYFRQIPLDYETEKHRGFAFVEFEQAEDAAAAVDNMHESELFGRTVSDARGRLHGNARTVTGRGYSGRGFWVSRE